MIPMASAILPSRNDQRSSDYMSKYTNNRHLNFMRVQNIPNPYPYHNPNSSIFFVGDTRNYQQFPYPAPQQAAFNSSSLNCVPANSYGYRYITFRLSSYTRTELTELKNRLVSDLERVRLLQQWIYFTTTQKTNYHPPALTLPAAVGRKRRNPSPPARDTKKQCGRMTNVQKRKMVKKKCEQILGKLMMHKHGWVFNTPVDAAALKLYDYHNVITNPMDLGTIKLKLTRNKYNSALAFASDVRLTFQNAMVYNGRGSAVYVMAERMLLLFEDLFSSVEQKRVVNRVKKKNESIEKAAVCVSQVVRVLKKREMTDEEKSELAESLHNLKLGPEGMEQIMAIVKKGVLGLEHQGDEIELDLALLDNDTLWALHSFIDCAPKVDHYAGNEEEEVDIGEEMQLTVFPSIEIEKDVVDVSSSESSSDSDSSSSGDSGSGCSCNEQEVNSTPKEI